MLSKERDDEGRPMGFLTRKEAREQKARDEAEAWDQIQREQGEQEAVLRSFKAAKQQGDGD